ncbi:LysR family transcriptional regulator [Undibacterium sp. TJN25]|uniref:LysR family transcriptional regulator n=1 Tax=Undibacterium sp. TJN25 TaxID=3413056 RepID=UPI003BF20292
MPSQPTTLLQSEHTDALASSFATSYAGVVAFITVVTEGSFAKAGNRLGIGRSAVSRSVQKLETQLDARLFVRTTRSTSLTREGELFYKNCHPGVERIVQAVEDMRELRDGPPRGRLRICSGVGFGRKVVAPLLQGFHAAYPGIALDFLLDDKPADFTAGRVDVAFRDGRMEDSQVVARKLIPLQMLVCASPQCAQEHGLPRSLEELAAHRCINTRLASGRIGEWEFQAGDRPHKVQPKAMSTFNDADIVLQAVLNGRGIAQLPAYQVCEFLRSGRLLKCLEKYAPEHQGHYICYLSRQQMPARIRVFIDYMTAHMRALDLQCRSDFSARDAAAMPTEGMDLAGAPCLAP